MTISQSIKAVRMCFVPVNLYDFIAGILGGTYRGRSRVRAGVQVRVPHWENWGEWLLRLLNLLHSPVPTVLKSVNRKILRILSSFELPNI